MAFQAEYIWLDGTSPTPLMRSKTKIVRDDELTTFPIWSFDGSSTGQATGDHSDCVLRPVFSCPDPLRGGANVLVLCDVLISDDMKPHPTNTRATCEKAYKKYAKQGMIFGLEQEYTMLKLDGSPLGFPSGGFPLPQGPYYCGVGAGRVIGREIIE
ncbi:MAG: glutamine synthetase beta-grasp domain-containing protein, partial [Ilumatobacteraceae bacterium]